MRKTIDMKLQAAFPIRQTEDHKTTTMERLQQVKAATIIQKHYRSWQLRRRQPTFDSATLIITDSRNNIQHNKSNHHIFSTTKLSRTLSNLSLRSLFSRKKSHANPGRDQTNSTLMLSPNVSAQRSESAFTVIPQVIQNLFVEDNKGKNHSPLRPFNSTPLSLRRASPMHRNRSKLGGSHTTLRTVEKPLSNSNKTITSSSESANKNSNSVLNDEKSKSNPILASQKSSSFDTSQDWYDDDGGNTIETTLEDASSLDTGANDNVESNNRSRSSTLNKSIHQTCKLIQSDNTNKTVKNQTEDIPFKQQKQVFNNIFKK